MAGSLAVTVTHRGSSILITDDEATRILDAIRWQEAPSFPRPGRSAWLALNEPALLTSDPTIRLKGAKLKGVGIFNPAASDFYPGIQSDAYSEVPKPPSTAEYTYRSQSWHFGFTPTGRFEMENSEPCPLGGMTHARALREFDAAQAILSRGGAATLPLFVAKYEDLMFRDQIMGAVVSLSADEYEYRCDSVLFGEGSIDARRLPYYELVRSSLYGSSGPPEKPARLSALMRVCREIGARVHSFAASGLYRHSGGLDNFIYTAELDRVLLTDLDSSRPLEELDRDVKALQIVRDLASVLFKFIDRFCHPKVMSQWRLDEMREADPIAEVIAGYFRDAAQSAVDGVSKRLWEMVPNVRQGGGVRKRMVGLAAESEEQMSLHSNMDLFYSLAVISLLPLFHSSGLAVAFPCQLTSADVLARSEPRLGHRYSDLLRRLER